MMCRKPSQNDIIILGPLLCTYPLPGLLNSKYGL